ncbi:hypothetical protein DPMN_026911 [Dreissena polymorpha]|uniref:Uncharacterized protein n=1 Tax=Dreissena polymorpha TaxID=45954 RepID=A0A9D4LTG0_DREPO|nr:hypothetical protein DPMN_026911 [Dreissena polymorpha]
MKWVLFCRASTSPNSFSCRLTYSGNQSSTCLNSLYYRLTCSGHTCLHLSEQLLLQAHMFRPYMHQPLRKAFPAGSRAPAIHASTNPNSFSCRLTCSGHTCLHHSEQLLLQAHMFRSYCLHHSEQLLLQAYMFRSYMPPPLRTASPAGSHVPAIHASTTPNSFSCRLTCSGHTCLHHSEQLLLQAHMFRPYMPPQLRTAFPAGSRVPAIHASTTQNRFSCRLTCSGHTCIHHSEQILLQVHMFRSYMPPPLRTASPADSHVPAIHASTTQNRFSCRLTCSDHTCLHHSEQLLLQAHMFRSYMPPPLRTASPAGSHVPVIHASTTPNSYSCRLTCSGHTCLHHSEQILLQAHMFRPYMHPPLRTDSPAGSHVPVIHASTSPNSFSFRLTCSGHTCLHHSEQILLQAHMFRPYMPPPLRTASPAGSHVPAMNASTSPNSFSCRLSCSGHTGFHLYEQLLLQVHVYIFTK